MNQNNNEGFFERVYEVTRLIPFGGSPPMGDRQVSWNRTFRRMVGWALNNSHRCDEFVPAHRVVNRNGLLTGKMHFGNSSTMRQLLENEGLLIENDEILNFREKFWDPIKELGQ